MATKCTKWDFGVMSKEDWKTADASGWAVVEQLQALNEFLAENQVLRCSTRITLDRILRGRVAKRFTSKTSGEN